MEKGPYKMTGFSGFGNESPNKHARPNPQQRLVNYRSGHNPYGPGTPIGGMPNARIMGGPVPNPSEPHPHESARMGGDGMGPPVMGGDVGARIIGGGIGNIDDYNSQGRMAQEQLDILTGSGPQGRLAGQTAGQIVKRERHLI